VVVVLVELVPPAMEVLTRRSRGLMAAQVALVVGDKAAHPVTRVVQATRAMQATQEQRQHIIVLFWFLAKATL